MAMIATLAAALVWSGAVAAQPQAAPAAPTIVVVDEQAVVTREPVPHGAIRRGTAYRIIDAAPGRDSEFGHRVPDPDGAIGLHVLTPAEVHHLLSGVGEVESDGVKRRVGPGIIAYLLHRANVGNRQVGAKPLSLIVAYALKKQVAPK